MDRVIGPLGSVSLVQEGPQKLTRLGLVAPAFNPHTQEKGAGGLCGFKDNQDCIMCSRTGQPGLHAETLSEKVDQVTWRETSVLLFNSSLFLGPWCDGLVPPACKSQGSALGSQDNLSCWSLFSRRRPQAQQVGKDVVAIA